MTVEILKDKIKDFKKELKILNVKRLVNSAKVYTAYQRAFGFFIDTKDEYTWDLHFINTKIDSLHCLLSKILENIRKENYSFDDYGIFTMNNKSVVIIQYKINKGE